MWRIFEPKGCAKLLLAEIGGEPLSGLLLIAFNDTVVCKKAGWSAKNPGLKSNELLHYRAMSWAREHGYRYYDFEGIPFEAAEKLLNGAKMSPSVLDPDKRYKLKYGGDVTLFPRPYYYITDPFIRKAHDFLYPRIVDTPFYQRIEDFIRKA
jgi:hypothetical protein